MKNVFYLTPILFLLPATSWAEQKQCHKEVICTIKVNEPDGRVSLWVEAPLPIQTTATVKFQVNSPVDQPSPVSIVLKGKDRKRVFITKRPVQRGFDIHFETSAFQGNPKAVHDSTAAYCLPYSKGSSYSVIQGYDGTFSHIGADRYSLDFALKEGTPVLAARHGFVLDQETSISGHSLSESDASKTNQITLVHTDGTFATYAHLQNKGSVVKIGQKVKAGQLIGYSGNTGFSSGPHLHFQVYIPGKGMTHQSIPTRFNTTLGFVSPLVEKQSYVSVCGQEMSQEEKLQTDLRQKILNTLEAYSPTAFDNCYAPYLGQFRKGTGEAPKQGLLEFNVQIASTGTIKSVVTIQNETLPKTIEDCVKKGVLALKFEPSKNDGLTVPYAVTFSFK